MHTAFSINQSLKILEYQEQTYADGSRCTELLQRTSMTGELLE